MHLLIEYNIEFIVISSSVSRFLPFITSFSYFWRNNCIIFRNKYVIY